MESTELEPARSPDHEAHRPEAVGAVAQGESALDGVRELPGAFAGAPGAPPGEGVTRLFTSRSLAAPSNDSLRTVAIRRAQATRGNRYVQRLVADFQRGSGAPVSIRRQCSCGGTCAKCQAEAGATTPGAMPAAPDEQHAHIQARGSDDSGARGEGLTADRLIPPGGGKPLDESTRQFMEPRFGDDFGDVRVHDDTPAGESARAIQADAYTTGRDIYFAPGKYAPETPEGQHLLAHELTHTIQQGDSAPPGQVAARSASPVVIGRADDPMEAEAERNADALAGRSQANFGVSDDKAAPVRRQGAAEKKDEGVLDYLGRKVGETAEAIENFAASKLEKYAPGLLALLRGDVVDVLREKIAAGFDGVFGGLIARVQKDGLVGALEGMVGDLIGGISKGVTQLASDACGGIAKASQSVFDFYRWVAGGAFDALKKGAAAVGGFFGEIWDNLGAPAWKAIKSFASDAWTWIEAKANWIWEKTAPIREGIASAWGWVKKQFNLAWDSGAGILDWLKAKAAAAWEKVKSALQPVMGPLKVIAGILVVLSPIGPIVLIWKAAPAIWDAMKWLYANWGKIDVVVQSRVILKDHILPAIISGVGHVTGLLAQAAGWLADQASSLTGALKTLSDALGVSAFLNAARRAAIWLSEQAVKLATWATTNFVKLVDTVTKVLTKIWDYAKPVLEVLVKVSIVIANPILLPIVIAGWGWRALPDCLKPPIIDFLLDLLTAAVRAIPNLSFFGEAWPATKQRIVATLGEVRSMDLPGKIAASDRVAKIMSGEDMSWIGDLLKGAAQVPKHLEGQLEEELIGMDLTEPLPFERTSEPSHEVKTSTAVEAGTLPAENASVLNRTVFSAGDIAVDQVATGELDPVLVGQLGTAEGSMVEFGESNDPSRSMEAIKAETLGEDGPPSPATSSAPAAETGPAPAAEKSTEERLQDMMNQPMPQTCTKAKEGAPEKGPGVPEHMKFGPLTRGQRASYLMNQMGKGVKNWFSCNAKWLVPTLIGVFAALVALEILTGGAVTAALPPLMEVIGSIMIGVAIVRVAGYVAEYLAKALTKDVAGAGKSLARGLAVGAIELVFALMFNLGDLIKVLKGELKLYVQGAAKAAKAAVRSTIESVEELGRIGVKGIAKAGENIGKFGRAIVKNGKIVLGGVGENIGRGAKSLGELAERLWNKVRFRRFRLRVSHGWFILEGYINPWVTLAELKIQLGKMREDIAAVIKEGQVVVEESAAGRKMMQMAKADRDKIQAILKNNKEFLEQARAFQKSGQLSEGVLDGFLFQIEGHHTVPKWMGGPVNPELLDVARMLHNFDPAGAHQVLNRFWAGSKLLGHIAINNEAAVKAAFASATKAERALLLKEMESIFQNTYKEVFHGGEPLLRALDFTEEGLRQFRF